jgi:hypothetical protein
MLHPVQHSVTLRWSFSVVLLLSFLQLYPSFTGFNADDGDGFLRVLKIRSMTSFEGEVNPVVSCCVRFCGILKIPIVLKINL